MKHFKVAAALLLMAFCILGCEKDDICPESTVTTPQIIISFYDVNNPSVAKNVTSLEVTANGMTDSLAVFNAESSIAIPLSITEDTVTYIFDLNSNNANSNEDLIKFNYTRTDVYVSRACGYKTLFALDPENPVELINNTGNTWIQEIDVVQPTIENEDETHINIYF